MPGPSWVGALASPDGLQARLDLDRPGKGPTIDLLLISSILEAQDWDLWKLLPFQEPVGHAWAGAESHSLQQGLAIVPSSLLLFDFGGFNGVYAQPGTEFWHCLSS